MHETQMIVTDSHGVCLPVCLSVTRLNCVVHSCHNSFTARSMKFDIKHTLFSTTVVQQDSFRVHYTEPM